MKKFPGFLITFEGIDGSGKSTVLHALEKKLMSANYQVLVTKQPGGTRFGAAVRTMVQQPEQPLTAQTEFLLFAADRAEHVAHVLQPALNQGHIVLCDRMADSSFAYQGYGRGVSLHMIESINRWVLQEVVPDLICYFAIDYKTARKRVMQRAEQLTSFDQEQESFFERVIEGYHALYQNRSDVLLLNAHDSIENNVTTIFEQINLIK